MSTVREKLEMEIRAVVEQTSLDVEDIAARLLAINVARVEAGAKTSRRDCPVCGVPMESVWACADSYGRVWRWEHRCMGVFCAMKKVRLPDAQLTPEVCKEVIAYRAPWEKNRPARSAEDEIMSTVRLGEAVMGMRRQR